MTGSKDRPRLDVFLVENGSMPSRARARDAIKRGTITVNQTVITKPGHLVDTDATVSVQDPASGYVSRAALKLISGLDAFNLSPQGVDALDIGASTGGFTQVLLERGASHVYAIDVGHGQMAPSLLDDPRVLNHEGINARALDAGLIHHPIRFVVSDVSFISLKLALPPALALAEPGAHGLFLVKPQFEVGKAHIGKNGLVKDPILARSMADEIADWLDKEYGWRLLGLADSPIMGGDGNQEYLLAARKDAP